MFTNFAENAVLNVLFRAQSAYKPAAIYIGLLTAVTDAEAGTVTEVSGGSYARVQVTQANANWDAPATVADGGFDWREIKNTNAIPFATATANWGTITHYGIYDASTSGNLIGVIALSTSRTINNTDTFTAAIGQIKIRLRGMWTNHGRDAILNSWFRTQSAYKPAAIYFGLLTAVSDALAGTVTEVSGGSYARQAITQADAQWNAPSNASGAQQISNVNVLPFPATGTASANWGACTHFGVYDASSSGNLIAIIALDATRTINSGDNASFAAGTLKLGQS